MVYLTNMSSLGAERSANAIYHRWFRTGSGFGDVRVDQGPPPGYLPGGPNEQYTGSVLVEGTSERVRDQPKMKTYSDTGDGDSIWAITEPGIYYQAAYINLLSRFTSLSTIPVDRLGVITLPASLRGGVPGTITIAHHAGSNQHLLVSVRDAGGVTLASLTAAAMAGPGQRTGATITLPTLIPSGTGTWTVQLRTSTGTVLDQRSGSIPIIGVADAVTRIQVMGQARRGGTVEIAFDYSAPGPREAKVMIFDPPWGYRGGTFPLIPATTGSTRKVQIAVPATMPLGIGHWKVELWTTTSPTKVVDRYGDLRIAE
jgi:hypothetical protein